jgi:hypothetical protein
MRLFRKTKIFITVIMTWTALVIAATFIVSNDGFAQGLPGTNAPGIALDGWAFEDTNWLTHHTNSPISFTNIINLEDAGDGNSLWLDTTNATPSFLLYRIADTNGVTNLTTSKGSISLWFSPDWSSANLGGTGPGAWGNLISAGYSGTNGPWWAWYLSADGGTVYFSSQTNGGTASTYLAAPVKFAEDQWYYLVLTYGPTNTAFYTNGVLVTNGSAITQWPGPGINQFAIGSDTNGYFQAGGLFDDLATFNYQLASNVVSDNFALNSIFFGIDQNVNGALVISAPPAPLLEPSIRWFNGLGFLQPGSAASSGVTNTNVSFTNWSAAVISSNIMDFHFAIAGGLSNTPYDVFATAALQYPITNASWYWQGQAYRGTNYALLITNYPPGNLSLILGKPQFESYGLTVAFEHLVIKSDSTTGFTYGSMPDVWIAINGLEGDPNILNEDPDLDGLNNWQEYLYGTRPLISEGTAIWVGDPAGFSGIP